MAFGKMRIHIGPVTGPGLQYGALTKAKPDGISVTMSLCWLHLSGWHQAGKDFDRRVVRDALVADIRERANRIDSALARVDFVIFGGGLAAGGNAAEYETACRKVYMNPMRVCLPCASVSAAPLMLV